MLLATTAFAQNDVGTVSFANSGAPAAQEDFLRGLALLHNFEYPRAAEAFQTAQKADPSFAMAYWGEAMTHTHPIWFQQDVPAARTVLERLGATPAERSAKPKTKRERDYLAAVETLYGDGTKEDRDLRYADAMAVVHERYPDDVNATAFYALALLGTAHEGRDFAIYMRAAALLEEVFPSNPRHPGVLHYLIHCYDDPAHAPLGMRAARLYGAVAPNAPHALHMTSHIFIALGMWDDVIDANRRAIEVGNRLRAERSKPPVHCGHIATWLHYAYLQEHRFAEAKKALEACRAEVVTEAPDAKFAAEDLASYVEMRANLVASDATSIGAEGVKISDGDDYADARFTTEYTEALVASRGGDVEALKSAVAGLRAERTAEASAMAHDGQPDPGQRARADVMVQEAEALLLLATGKEAEGLALLETAAKTEQAMPFEFGPPFVPKPAYELLADRLAGAGRASDAEAAYRSALLRAPGRTPALQGLFRAQKASGQVEAAEQTEAQLARYHAKGE
jgi:hypothetical protein